MEDTRMENFWEERLTKIGWSDRAIAQVKFGWADSTRDLYSNMLNKCKDFCYRKGFDYPPQESHIVAAFLCELADGTLKPASYLNSATAALSAMYTGLGWTNIASDADISMLKRALVKSGTRAPRERSTVMPVKPFIDMFLRWEENDLLPIKDLRLKTITLLALTVMLRPSDIAPRSKIFDPVMNITKNIVFSKDNIQFNEDGSATLSFFGIKNDLHRSGFVERLPPHSVAKLDPVAALKVYIERTESFRPTQDKPLFLTLSQPFRAISSSTVASILESAITRAGLDNQMYTASFRPTGATLAIESGKDPDMVMKMGRWKTRSVFMDHYVHSRTPEEFTEDILSGIEIGAFQG
jgi:hypothetical protein